MKKLLLGFSILSVLVLVAVVHRASDPTAKKVAEVVTQTTSTESVAAKNIAKRIRDLHEECRAGDKKACAYLATSESAAR